MKREELDPKASFLFIASMQVAVQMKESGINESQYMEWCKEIWKSVEMNDLNELKHTLQCKMRSDIMEFSKDYTKDI